MTAPYLHIQNATVYQGQTCVLRDFSLELFRGENTCILGPNGAGKSTLLKLLTRELYPVVKPDSFVKIDGHETAIIWELRKKIGVVSQDLQNQYDAHIYGRDVIMSGLFGAIGMHGHFEVTPEHHAKVDAALERYQLTELQHRRYWHLSTGQQRKFLLARAMIHQPEILVLDEPTNGLDIKAAFDLINQLRKLAANGTTLLLVTHHVQEIIPEIERVVFLQGGKVIESGAKPQLMTSSNLSKLYDTQLNLQERDGYFQVLPKTF